MAATPKKVMQQPMANLTPRQQDVLLTPDRLRHFRLFRDLKKPVPLERFPGTMVLRRYRAGEVICRQGEFGYSAFYLPFLSDAGAMLEGAEEPEGGGGSESETPQEVATVVIMTEGASAGEMRRTGWFGRRPAKSETVGSEFIPIDGPEDVDRISGIASLREGDIFGEATCLRYTPRSATVIAARDCYAIEFLRNILDHLCRDAAYRAYIEQVYRERALKGHLRQLPLFRDVEEGVLDELRDEVHLEFIDAGSIVIEEGSRGDSLYLVRRGVVQVTRGLDLERLTIAVDDVSDWSQLCRQIIQEREDDRQSEEEDAPSGRGSAASDPLAALKGKSSTKKTRPLLEWLDELGAQALVEQCVHSESVSDDVRTQLARALTQVAHSREFLANLPLSIWDRPGLQRIVADIPTGTKGIASRWTDLQVRTAGRRAMHELYARWIRPPRAPGTVPRVLAYLAPGECFGELAVLGPGTPRTATCIVYEHAQSDLRTQAELVRVDGAVVRRLAERSAPLRKALNQLAKQREQELAELSTSDELATGFQSSRDELGLAEGQQLLLIDLDRCTRCGDCVRACVSTHDDGRTRLFLDGPRYRRYLVPSACRQCVDPVCMIGCPVGSIHRGDGGEIRIESWCIGCELCAKQCPYDSIQMHDVGLVPTTSRWRAGPVAGAGNGRPPRLAGSSMMDQTAPVLWNIETQAAFGVSRRGDGTARCVAFQNEFPVQRRQIGRAKELLLTLSTPGLQARAWLNGTACAIDGVFRRKRLVGYEGRLPVSLLRGRNRLVVELQASDEVLSELDYGAELFSCRLDVVPPVEDLNRKLAGLGIAEGDGSTAAIEIKLVEQHAVVCDLCTSLPTGPACVAMCPHDAAIRVNGHEEMGVRL